MHSRVWLKPQKAQFKRRADRHKKYGVYEVSSNDGIGRLRAIEQQFDAERVSVADRKSLEDARTRYLSRKSGLLTLELQNLGKLPKEQRAEFGRVANEVKVKIEAALETLETAITQR